MDVCDEKEAGMLLAEALAERADIQARLSSLKQRAEQGARIQEGDAPVEHVPTPWRKRTGCTPGCRS